MTAARRMEPADVRLLRDTTRQTRQEHYHRGSDSWLLAVSVEELADEVLALNQIIRGGRR